MQPRLIARSLFAAFVAALVLVGVAGAAPTSRAQAFVAYGFGTIDPSRVRPGFVAVSFPSGVTLGRVEMRRQGGGFAVAPDGRQVYVLDGERFLVLAAPGLRILHEMTLPDRINILGNGQVVAVAPSGDQVYVETTRIIGPNRWDPTLRVGQPDSQYGLAIYDVAKGRFTKEIWLDPPWCGVAGLSALPNGRVAVFCPTALDVRLVDLRLGKQVATVSLGSAPRAGNLPGWPIRSVLAPDGSHLLVVEDNGTLLEVDLARMAITHVGTVGDGLRQDIPLQAACPCLTANGHTLVIPAAPADALARATGNATVAWLANPALRPRTTTVPLPAPASSVVLGPDDQTVLVSSGAGSGSRQGTWLLHLPDGHPIADWPGELIDVQIARRSP